MDSRDYEEPYLRDEAEGDARMTTHDRDKIIAAAKEAGICIDKFGWTTAIPIEKIEAFYASVAASRDAENYRLRDQVTLLRDVMSRIAFTRTGKCIDLAQELFDREDWASEAFATTEPK